jgi:hypothetical protein
MRRVEALVMFALALAVILLLAVAARNVNLLFAASAREGKLIRLRGRAPNRLLGELQDVLQARPVRAASIRVVLQDRRPFLRASGDVRPEELQRLRNVLGTWDVAKIRAAPFRSGPIRHLR